MPKIRCPKCKEVISVASLDAGTPAECLHCGLKMVMPGKKSSPPTTRSSAKTTQPTRDPNFQLDLAPLHDDPLGIKKSTFVSPNAPASASPMPAPVHRVPTSWTAPQPSMPNSTPHYAQRRQSGGGGLKTCLVVAAVVMVGGMALTVISIGGGVAYYLLVVANTPTKTYERTTMYINTKQWGKIWDQFDKSTQERFDSQLSQIRLLPRARRPPQFRDVEGMSGREMFVAMCEKGVLMPHDELIEHEVLSETIDGDRATLEVRDPKLSRIQKIQMVKEDGLWKLTFENTAAGRTEFR